MADESFLKSDPCDSSGPFGELFQQIRACKDARTCPLLRVRQFYFEPNPTTYQQWQAEGLYSAKIDRRVVFVCESPSNVEPLDTTEPERSWAVSSRDQRFREARLKYGFSNCYITDAVKCGVRRGRRHTDDEIAACSGFLCQELELIRPTVVVGMGGNAYQTLTKHILPVLADPPVTVRITHYSARGDVWLRWEEEFRQLDQLLAQRKPRPD